MSSDSDLTDKNFEDNISIDSDEIEESLQKQFSSQFVEEVSNHQTETKVEKQELTLLNEEESDEDILFVITQNENMFKHYGEKKLKDQRNLSL